MAYAEMLMVGGAILLLVWLAYQLGWGGGDPSGSNPPGDGGGGAI